VERIDRQAFETVEHAAEEAMTFPEPDPTHMEDEVYAP
jgi:TPP-dependent pyruvate/acetoin dehydrogenase alpha subunit